MEEEGEEDAEGDRRPHEVEDEGQGQGLKDKEDQVHLALLAEDATKASVE